MKKKFITKQTQFVNISRTKKTKLDEQESGILNIIR